MAILPICFFYIPNHFMLHCEINTFIAGIFYKNECFQHICMFFRMWFREQGCTELTWCLGTLSFNLPFFKASWKLIDRNCQKSNGSFTHLYPFSLQKPPLNPTEPNQRCCIEQWKFYQGSFPCWESCFTHLCGVGFLTQNSAILKAQAVKYYK